MYARVFDSSRSIGVRWSCICQAIWSVCSYEIQRMDRADHIRSVLYAIENGSWVLKPRDISYSPVWLDGTEFEFWPDLNENVVPNFVSIKGDLEHNFSRIF